ncbi:hypothetical protein K1719_017552 [Acacia pycnantha]|nr:hypothetical protein K1719_017552 [Acacia pycnantha]
MLSEFRGWPEVARDGSEECAMEAGYDGIEDCTEKFQGLREKEDRTERRWKLVVTALKIATILLKLSRYMTCT